TGNGTVAKSPDQTDFVPGTVVQLTASPAMGWHFVSWGGDASGSTNPITQNMNGAKSVTATFAINTYTLTVTSGPNGSVAKNPNQPTYDHGPTVTLTATPGAGYHFVGWSGDTTATANPLALIMTRNRTLTATFAINTYSLTVTTAGSGTVTKSPNLASYDHGTAVTVTATPDPGYHFVSW